MMQVFPEDEATFGMDDQYMLGSAILVKPIASAGQLQTTTYLPFASNWYDFDTLSSIMVKTTMVSKETPLEKVCVYLRGGSIVPSKYRIRRSSSLTTLDPFTLVVALDYNV